MENCRRCWTYGTKIILSVFLISLSGHTILLNLDCHELNDNSVNHTTTQQQHQKHQQEQHQKEQKQSNHNGSKGIKTVVRFANGSQVPNQGTSRHLSAVNVKHGYNFKLSIHNLTRKTTQALSVSKIKEFLLSRSGLHNRFEFDFMINEPYRCKDEESMVDPFLLVLILSHPLYKIRRDAIRDTWGTISHQFGGPLPVRTLFVIGRDKEQYTNFQILHESKMYRDIIQLDIEDVYSNLTLKTVLGLKWVIDHCSAVSFVLKSDDDTMVNMTGLLNILRSASRDHLLLGSLNVNAKVMRMGRWGLMYDQYPFDVFPPYLNGAAYVMSMDMVHTLFHCAKMTKLLPLEDVHLTGIIPLLTTNNLTSNDAFAYWSTRVTSPCEMVKRKLITAHGVQPEMMYDIWKFTTRLNKCSEN